MTYITNIFTLVLGPWLSLSTKLWSLVLALVLMPQVLVCWLYWSRDDVVDCNVQVHVRVSSGMRHCHAADRVVQGRGADDPRHDRLQGRSLSSVTWHRRTWRLSDLHVQGYDLSRQCRDHGHGQGQRSVLRSRTAQYCLPDHYSELIHGVLYS